MKKRMKLKKQKQHNLQMLSKLLAEIGGAFTVQNVTVGKGYHLFSFGSSSVCHFMLKETPEWRYGIWLQGEVYQIFGEHVDLIDKFKPSRAYISRESDVPGFVDDVMKVAENPTLYFVDSLTGIAFIDFKDETHDGETWHTGYQVKRTFNEMTKLFEFSERDRSITQEVFVKNRYEQFQKDKIEQKECEEWDKRYAFEFFPTLLTESDHILAVGIYDGNKGGAYCSPRYTIDVVVNPSIQQEEADKLYLSLDNLVNDKNFSDDRKTYQHQFSLGGLYDGLDVLKQADYSFKKNTQ